MNSITTIDGVIAQLDEIIEWCIANKSRMGYFATMYRRMTVAVKQGILANQFQDGKRMEQLDIIFASRYFDAWSAYTSQRPCSNSWHSTFDACQDSELIVLQHLLLGVNTHINLDLAIASAQCCPGNSIYALQPDFQKINDIIETQSQLIQDSLSKIWPPLEMLTNISNNQEKAILNFSVANARRCSWANAIVLANLHDTLKSQHIAQIDNMVVGLGEKIINPGILMGFLLKPVRMMEDADTDKMIELLKD